MPIATLPSDTFTRDNLLLGFPVVTFTPALTGGGFDTPVELGILSAASLQKVVNVLQLQRGDSGTLTVDREIVNQFEAAFEVASFNFKSDLAKFLWASSSTLAIVADATSPITNEAVQVPASTSVLTASESFVTLNNSGINAAGQVLTCAQVTETITGNGTGTTDGDYTLAFKPLVLADVNNGTTLEFTETIIATGALVRTYTVQVGEPLAETEAQLTVGVGATSGQLDLFQTVPSTNQLNLIYTPSHVLETDFDAVNPDMMLDPLLGRIRFPNIDSFAVPDGTSALRTGQDVEFDYTFNRLASTQFKPFTQLQSDGKLLVRQLASVGVNFDWEIPSSTLRITDDDLTFGAEDFATAIFRININDNGGTDRFGTLKWSSETEANA